MAGSKLSALHADGARSRNPAMLRPSLASTSATRRLGGVEILEAELHLGELNLRRQGILGGARSADELFQQLETLGALALREQELRQRDLIAKHDPPAAMRPRALLSGSRPLVVFEKRATSRPASASPGLAAAGSHSFSASSKRFWLT